jgi:hypothetical protein
MTDKHTIGPWSYLPRHIAESEPEVRAPAGWLICCTAGDADARLIAAAPDLLEACRLLLSSAHDYQTGVAEAEAAIAKATGGVND